MNFSDVILKRYSVRSYTKQAIEEEKLQKILNAGRLAPSAVNFQPWYFIVVKEQNREKLNQVYSREWFKSAPVAIVVCSDHSRSWKRNHYDNKDFADVDAAIAIDHIILQATALGLGTCWVCNFDVDACRKLLELPAYIEPVALIPLGYPDDTPTVKKRNKLSDVVCYEKFELNKPNE